MQLTYYNPPFLQILFHHLEYLENLCESVKMSSRCGLGQTSPNPVASTLKNFRSEYETLINEETDTFLPSFDIHKALDDAESITNRKSVIFSE